MSFGGSSPDHRLIDATIENLQKQGARISAVFAREQHHSDRQSSTFPIACCRSFPPSIPPNQSPPLSSSNQYSTTSMASGTKTARERSASQTTLQKSSDILRFLGEHKFPCFLMEGNKTVERMANIKLYSKDTSEWIWMQYTLKDSDGKEVLVVQTEVKGAETKNLVVNGRKLD